MLKRHYLFSAIALVLVGCGSSEFRGGSVVGGATENNSDDATAENVAEPTENDDGSITPVDSGTEHGDFGLNESVVFGNDTVYRVGDGTVKGTSCMENVEAHNLSGKKYSFSFEVSNDETTLQIKIDTLCGLDVDQFNLLYIESASGQVQKAVLSKDQTNVVLQAIKLNKGKYSLIVESTKITSGTYRNHFDDFIVGKIFVNSDKKIIPGEISAY